MKKPVPICNDEHIFNEGYNSACKRWEAYHKEVLGREAERIAEVIYDETNLDWELCQLVAERIVNKDWR